ncbi:uncharacterized protein TNCV_4858871 [Trichonephila clavipes]|nr:uncharacterized protein TNCV_4858871 [Trichonephila clavipes]
MAACRRKRVVTPDEIEEILTSIYIYKAPGDEFSDANSDDDGGNNRQKQGLASWRRKQREAVKISKTIAIPADCKVRSVIRILNAKNIKEVEIHRQPVEIYGKNATRRVRPYEWRFTGRVVVYRSSTSQVRVLFPGWTDHLIGISAPAPQYPMVTYTGMGTENGTWRRRSNLELYQSYKESDIDNLIKIQRIKWASHVVRMGEDRTIKKKSSMLNRLAHEERAGQILRWIDGLKKDLLVRRTRLEH